MRIVTIPCLRDNYAYLLVCEETRQAAVVDPSEAAPVLAAIEAEDVQVTAIWNTHHHYDHVGGNEEIAKRFSGCAIVAHESDKGRVPGQTVFVKDGDSVAVGKEVRATVIFNPGHTLGAISYLLETPAAVFTGDTLFAAGCGRTFEGTAEQMHTSLVRLTSLAPETQVYCGHEYTVSNLGFAAAAEPGNAAIADRAVAAKALRAQGLSTMGFTVADELATNVFVRCAEQEVGESARREEEVAGTSEVDVFAGLRTWKDRF
jgi:hydroxyacylglutathione hydrolase